MIEYLLTSMDRHPDNGYGVMGNSYYQSAKILTKYLRGIESTYDLPEIFLYRHSIELYLKSLILIFKLVLKQDKTQEIIVNGKPVKIYDCHNIEQLYSYWSNELLIPMKESLETIAPEGDWKSYNKFAKYAKLISQYDEAGTFLRYPTSKDLEKDKLKDKVKKTNAKSFFDLADQLEEMRVTGNISKGLTLLVLDDKDQFVENFDFKNEKHTLPDMKKAIKKLSNYLSCMHVMSRVTLCDGY